MPSPAALATEAAAEACGVRREEGLARLAVTVLAAGAWAGAVAVTGIAAGAAPDVSSLAAVERARTSGAGGAGITLLPSVSRPERARRAPAWAAAETDPRSAVGIDRRLAAAGHAEAIIAPKSPAEETAPGNGRTSARTPATAIRLAGGSATTPTSAIGPTSGTSAITTSTLPPTGPISTTGSTAIGTGIGPDPEEEGTGMVGHTGTRTATTPATGTADGAVTGMAVQVTGAAPGTPRRSRGG